MVDAVAEAIRQGAIGVERRPAFAYMLENRLCPDDVEIAVVLAGERCRRRVFGRRAGPDGVCGVQSVASERADNFGRDRIGNGASADCLAVGICRNTESRRYVNAVDPRQLTEVSALSPGRRNLRRVDPTKIDYVTIHRSSTLPLRPGLSASPPSIYILVVGRPRTRTGGPHAIRPRATHRLSMGVDVIARQAQCTHRLPMGSPRMDKKAPDLLPGTLEMIALRTLLNGPMHGYGIAQRVKTVSRDVLQIGGSSLSPPCNDSCSTAT